MEKQYLIDDFKLEESWRLFKIIGEFVDGVEALHHIGPAVSIFGSARVAPGVLGEAAAGFEKSRSMVSADQTISDRASAGE